MCFHYYKEEIQWLLPFFFFLEVGKIGSNLKEGIMYLKVFGSGFVSLYAASECLTVFSCLNKKPLQTRTLLLSIGFVKWKSNCINHVILGILGLYYAERKQKNVLVQRVASSLICKLCIFFILSSLNVNMSL